MASFQGTRFPGPMHDQNNLRNSFNVNPTGNRHPGPSFQRPPYVQPPEGMHGNFQNRPPFSNFLEGVNATVFRNGVPPLNQVFRMNSPPPNQIFRMSSPPPNQAFRMNAPPPNQVFRFNSAPPNQAFHIPAPNQAFRMNPAPSTQTFHMNSSPNQAFRMNSPPNQAFRLKSPPPNQAFRMKSPPSSQRFLMESPRTSSRSGFSGHLERPFRPQNQMPSFGVPKSSFQDHQRRPLQSHQSSALPFQGNKRKKQKTREFRKLKEDPTEKPFSCDTCDRAFVTENELKDHLSLHIKCDRGNCTFEAHPKVVALHQKMQHDTGYADKINKLYDEAEIQKWREERRRRYPTAENIRKRKAEQAEKEARGEILEAKEFGKFKRRREGNEKGANNDNGRRVRNYGPRTFKRRRNFYNRPYCQPFTVDVDLESDSDSDSHITLNKFLGLSSLTNSDETLHGDNEKVNASPNSLTITNTAKYLPESDSDQTSILINDDKIHEGKSLLQIDISSEKDNIAEDLASPANESICEITTNEAVSVEPEIIALEDSADESPDSVEIIKSVGIKNNDFDDEGPEILRIKKSKEKFIMNESKGFERTKNQHPDESPDSVEIIKSVGIKNNDSADESPDTVQIIKSVGITNTDFDDEGPEILRIEKSKEKFIMNSSKGFEKTKNQHHNADQHKNESNLKDEKSNGSLKKDYLNQNGHSNRQNHVFHARKSSLLEKLMADDIRHERNVILQCIRHIVNNNFYGIGCKKKS